MNYYRRHLGDYLKKTSRFSILEHGAYTLMLDYYYIEEGPLPLDRDEIYRMVRATHPEERLAVDRVLDMKFDRRSDGYHNDRADAEIAIAVQARENGKRGGRPRGADNITQAQTEDVTENVTGTTTETGTEKRGTSETHPSSILHPPSSNLKPTNLHPPPPNRRKKTPAVLLPGWLNPEKFAAWMAIRPAKARTAQAQLAAIEKLDGFRSRGLDPNEIVSESLANGWQGIFEPKASDVRRTENKQESLEERNRRVAEAWVPPEVREANARRSS